MSVGLWPIPAMSCPWGMPLDSRHWNGGAATNRSSKSGYSCTAHLWPLCSDSCRSRRIGGWRIPATTRHWRFFSKTTIDPVRLLGSGRWTRTRNVLDRTSGIGTPMNIFGTA